MSGKGEGGFVRILSFLKREKAAAVSWTNGRRKACLPLHRHSALFPIDKRRTSAQGVYLPYVLLMRGYITGRGITVVSGDMQVQARETEFVEIADMDASSATVPHKPALNAVTAKYRLREGTVRIKRIEEVE
jgi:hypothetical protein